MPPIVDATLEETAPALERTGIDAVDSPSFIGKALGELLAAAGVAPEKIDEALTLQTERGGRLGDILVQQKVCTEEQVARALAQQLRLDFATQIAADEVAPELVQKVPINFAKQARLIPLRLLEDGSVLCAVGDPLDTAALDNLSVLLDAPLTLQVTPTQSIVDAINAIYDRAANESQRLVDDLEAEDLASIEHALEEPQDLLDTNDEAPIIRLVNSLLFRAVKERASDIHIIPSERDIDVRFRIDGVLAEVIRPPKRFQSSIASRVKIMGGLNIAEKRLPQDGRIRIKLAGKDIDIRLSTTPTIHGERIVMRLLDKSAVLLELNSIGFDTHQLTIMESLIHKSHGIVLVTGPTGSGKTTTLYAALARINTPDLNIMTVEDPVEYQLKGISQTPVNAKIDLTFANGLRSFLRQDPDVIMVGEIRDLETAEIAIQAALTGHLVFSTVHTNDAPGAITRLVDMGVQPFLVASSVVGILAQRLVRVLCEDCKKDHVPTAEELAEIGLTTADVRAAPGGRIYSPQGCKACNNVGYRGRLGIYELMLIDADITQLILKNVDSGTIKREAVKKGMRTLLDDGANKVLQGKTSIAEVLSVTQEDMN